VFRAADRVSAPASFDASSDRASSARACKIPTVTATRETIKLYFDYKSPFAYLAKDPAFQLAERYRIEVRWIPFVLRLKGPGERSVYSDRKAKYSYMDARRWANRRGGFIIKGPPKIYDSRPALIGGLFAQQHGFFRPYTDRVFSRFFERTLEVDVPAQVGAVIEELGGSAAEYHDYLNEAGAEKLEECLAEADQDLIFGVPIFVFRGELFWGHDRMGLLEERLAEARLG
jgi:2-hydroxychromene-2-carboxylate isomerase